MQLAFLFALCLWPLAEWNYEWSVCGAGYGLLLHERITIIRGINYIHFWVHANTALRVCTRRWVSNLLLLCISMQISLAYIPIIHSAFVRVEWCAEGCQNWRWNLTPELWYTERSQRMKILDSAPKQYYGLLLAENRTKSEVFYRNSGDFSYHFASQRLFYRIWIQKGGKKKRRFVVMQKELFVPECKDLNYSLGVEIHAAHAGGSLGISVDYFAPLSSIRNCAT